MSTRESRSAPVFISSDDLAYWYLRLNGFLTIKNFVLHPDTGTRQRTDIDVLGVRFPYRRELVHRPMVDERLFTVSGGVPFLIIAEVKRGICGLNGPWTDPEKKNMHGLLSAIGMFEASQIDSVSTALYERGRYTDEHALVSLCCLGAEANIETQMRYADVPQRLWSEVLEFIYNRFISYRDQKASHGTWDSTGTRLYNLALSTHTLEEFRALVRVI